MATAIAPGDPIDQSEPDLSELDLVASVGREDSARIGQDASVDLIRTGSPETIPHAPGRGIWLHVIRGTAPLAGTTLHPGDAASSVEEPALLEIQAGPDGLDALLLDLL